MTEEWKLWLLGLLGGTGVIKAELDEWVPRDGARRRGGEGKEGVKENEHDMKKEQGWDNERREQKENMERRLKEEERGRGRAKTE